MSYKLDAIEAARADIYYMSRASYTLYFTVTDINSEAVDLSGASLIWQVKKKKTDPESVAELTSKITVTGDNNNIVGLPLDLDLEERYYWHGLKNRDTDKPIMYGKFEVTESVND